MEEKEKLTLVVSEAQLAPGLLMELRPCLECNKPHRFLLVKLAPFDPFAMGQCWNVQLSPHTARSGLPALLDVGVAISIKSLYIVETGLDVNATRHEGKNLPRDVWFERKQLAAYGVKGPGAR